MDTKEIKHRINCNFCGEPTGMFEEDFDKDKDLSDVYCSSECRYEFETGHPGEEY